MAVMKTNYWSLEEVTLMLRLWSTGLPISRFCRLVAKHDDGQIYRRLYTDVSGKLRELSTHSSPELRRMYDEAHKAREANILILHDVTNDGHPRLVELKRRIDRELAAADSTVLPVPDKADPRLRPLRPPKPKLGKPVKFWLSPEAKDRLDWLLKNDPSRTSGEIIEAGLNCLYKTFVKGE